MDYQSKKILKYLNKHSSMKFSISELHTIFPNIDKDYLIEIVHNLNKNNYIKFIGNSSIRSTNKGKTYFYISRSNWISQHIVSILALIVSFLAFIVATISLILQYLK